MQPNVSFVEKNGKDKSHLKVRHHCHFTGKHRGLSHSMSNPKFLMPNESPVIFHSGLKHDYHHGIISG